MATRTQNENYYTKKHPAQLFSYARCPLSSELFETDYCIAVSQVPYMMEMTFRANSLTRILVKNFCVCRSSVFIFYDTFSTFPDFLIVYMLMITYASSLRKHNVTPLIDFWVFMPLFSDINYDSTTATFQSFFYPLLVILPRIRIFLRFPNIRKFLPSNFCLEFLGVTPNSLIIISYFHFNCL